MNPKSIAAAAFAAALSPLALGASPGAPLAPVYPDGAALTRHCEAALASVRKGIEAMAAKKGPDGIFAEWNRMFIQVEDGSNAAALYATVHPVREVRSAGEACEEKFKQLNTEVNQNEKLFERVRAAKPASPREAKLQRDLLRDFEDSGVALPMEKRSQAKALFEKIETHRQAFERNVREDNTKVAFTPAELEGVPEAFLKTRKRDDGGNYALGLDQPSYSAVMSGA
jgi:thimet oligopeptidase